MTKTAIIEGTAAHLAMAALAMTPAVEESVRRTYEKRPGTLEEGRPDRVSIERSSRFYTNCGAYLAVLIDGEPATHCVEYCVSGGWVRLGTADPSGRVSASAAARAEKKFGVVDVAWKFKPSRQVRRQMERIGR